MRFWDFCDKYDNLLLWLAVTFATSAVVSGVINHRKGRG